MQLFALADSIRGRLAVASATVGTLLVTSGAFAWWSAHQLSSAVRERMGAVRVASELSAEFGAVIAQEMQAGHHYVDAPNPADRGDFARLSEQAHEVAAEMNARVGQSEDETRLIARIDQQLALAESYYDRAQRLADLGRRADAARESEAAAPITRAMLEDLQQLGALTARKVAETSTRLEAETLRQRWIQLAVFALFVLVGIVVFRQVRQSIARPLDALVDHARRLSAGDFAARTATAPLPREFRVLADAMNREGSELSALTEREAELRQTEKHAAVGQLVSGVAHELSDPLAGVLLQTERMLEERPDPTRRRMLEEVRSHALRARRIVRDLLSFVHDRAAAYEPVALAGLVQSAVDGLGEWLARNRVTVTTDVPAAMHRLMVDRVGIEQVISNLVLNAAQACGPGGRITVRGEPTHDGARLVVEDNGPGIPPAVLPRIFEPFFSARGDGATGLGLSAALGIIEQHRGTLAAENGPPGSGIGARFTIVLPAAYDTAGFPVPRPASAAAPLPHAARPRVLIVEADAGARGTLRRHFERRGWRVDEARSAQEACAVLLPSGAGEDYVLLVGDLTARCPDGATLHARLGRERPGLLRRAVHVADDAQSRDTRRLVAAAGCAAVQRPVDDADLEAVTRDLVGARA